MKLFQMHQCAMAFRPEMTLWPKTILSNLKWLLGQKRQWIAFLLEISFQPIILLSNLIVFFWPKMAFWLQMPYFSKYWKVWLAFDGWKLSGLFSKIFRRIDKFKNLKNILSNCHSGFGPNVHIWNECKSNEDMQYAFPENLLT